MISTARIGVFGGPELSASVAALGFEAVDDAADIAIVDTRDDGALLAAAALPLALPRIFVAGPAQRGLIAALGVDPARVIESCDPAVLGPIVTATVPVRRRSATHVVVVTAVRGGAGRTLLVTNLALRIAPKLRVCVVDATGTGAAAWWLKGDARPWSALEGLADELSPDQLSVLAEEVAPHVRIVGGASIAPSEAVLVAATRAAAALDDLVIVDAPLAVDRSTRSLEPLADRTILLAYDDPFSVVAVDAAASSESVWLVASQSRSLRLGGRDVFRALPRDESAVAAALERRRTVGGQLGRAYDELAELLLIDAS